MPGMYFPIVRPRCVTLKGYNLDGKEFVREGQDLLSRMDVSPRDVLRVRGTQAHELGLTDPAASDEALIAAMIIDPILVAHARPLRSGVIPEKYRVGGRVPAASDRRWRGVVCGSFGVDPQDEE